MDLLNLLNLSSSEYIDFLLRDSYEKLKLDESTTPIRIAGCIRINEFN